ncbi:beta-ketoacyl-ACP synthase II [Alphaproteobacteria bacterium]|jgi:3-oxoacyl-[acyl-carrier-protein] synthase II|nr:beta-ketoacyl-ACP synthase II [Alphaproteobacteria bacterium]MDA9189915.1 beta-ketoacyl-ACP synthase II [Alphaproteobacteria bacterium]MDA9816005.1 beta-ketoacyl-ACP synthase II [Alphaproteobacteria bacterium]
MRRVVITGIGMVTPLGQGVGVNWQNLLAGKSGISKIESFDVSDISCQIAGTVPSKDKPNGLDMDAFIEPKEQRKIDRFIQLGIIAAIEAVQDSNWVAKTVDQQERTGVMIGSGIGGLQTIVETAELMNARGPRKISPFFIPAALINLISGHVSIKYGFKGPNHSVVTACSTGAHAIGDAARMISIDDADIMVAGGAEAAVCRLGMAGFAAARALSGKYNETPEIASRPWDTGRDGFVMGEGAGVVVLEEYEHAIARGAHIYGEIKGYGLSGDAHHITAPASDGDGGFRAMRNALNRAKLMPSQIDYINAHGTSTPLGDLIEAGAVMRLFEACRDTLSMSSTKSATGHLLGAAGAIEAIYSLLAVRDNMLPPTLNLNDKEDALGELDLVPLKSRSKTIRNVMSNSFGFGGTNASLIIGEVD